MIRTSPPPFYGGHTPDQAAAAAQPYQGLMLNPMDPAARSSVLFNEIRGKQGGKKASDSGKNEQHGNGGKAKAKAEKNKSTN
ncbi:hypothetical protein QW131_15240 [Roseibium salinum]|nr:hypothetical protein [Roseibium salinum]